MLEKVKSVSWYWWLTFFILAAEAAVFLFFGQDSYIGIHDNLDIHIVDYQIMALNDAFFAHQTELPLLGGIDRNYFASEFSLYTLLYILLPNFAAYITGHFLKILLALFSVILLWKDILQERYPAYEPLAVLGGLAYGLLPLYPAFSFSFASIPLLIYLIRQILRTPSPKNYLLLFLYPLLSYFTFFGLFLLGYLLLYTVYVGLRSRKFPGRLAIAIGVLSAGYIVFEYRLFFTMLAENTATIRDTMVMGDYSAIQVTTAIADAFINGVFHAFDFHKFLVMPICLIGFFVMNFFYLREKEISRIFREPFNGILLLIVINCVIYGFYNWEDLRVAFETLLPPLKGWQFGRTVFFNPFLWYAAFFLLLRKLYDERQFKLSNALALASVLVILGSQSLYNDFYNTVYTHAWKLVKQKETESLSYREFYSTELFEAIKADIGYEGEYSAAYGMHPAVLQYNGIATLDACFSYYPLSYKEKFRRVIAPALEQSEVARTYYDEWGGRVYLVSGTDENIWNPIRTMKVTDYALSIDSEAFRDLGGTYIFSRIPVSNCEALAMELVGEYGGYGSPYTIYVYRNL